MHTRTSGGASDTEQTAVTVSPRGLPCRSRVVTTVTPATRQPMIARKRVVSSAIYPRFNSRPRLLGNRGGEYTARTTTARGKRRRCGWTAKDEKHAENPLIFLGPESENPGGSPEDSGQSYVLDLGRYGCPLRSLRPLRLNIRLKRKDAGVMRTDRPASGGGEAVLGDSGGAYRSVGGFF